MGMPKGKEQSGTTVAAGESWVAKLAQKAVGFAFDKAIDVYFGDGPGKEVDAGAMHRLETKTPGFVVMAADKDEGARILSQGFEKALADAANDQASVLSKRSGRGSCSAPPPCRSRGWNGSATPTRLKASCAPALR